MDEFDAILNLESEWEEARPCSPPISCPIPTFLELSSYLPVSCLSFSLLLILQALGPATRPWRPLAVLKSHDGVQEGRKEGQKAGKQQGIVDGRLLGLEKGHELGHELGYYAGCAEAWLRLYHAQMAAAAAESSEPHAAGGEEHGTEAAAKSGGESENQCEDQEKAQGGKAAKGGVKGTVSERTAKNLKAIVELVETFPVSLSLLPSLAFFFPPFLSLAHPAMIF
eukprot:2762552-Rhodomonas_salina.1